MRIFDFPENVKKANKVEIAFPSETRKLLKSNLALRSCCLFLLLLTNFHFNLEVSESKEIVGERKRHTVFRTIQAHVRENIYFFKVASFYLIERKREREINLNKLSSLSNERTHKFFLHIILCPYYIHTL
jgi:hypothetical protein